MSPPLTRRSIAAQAWPIIIGQASIPLVGLVDTAVIGRTGDAVALAAVALGTTVINLVFWSFGFLRMGMTGMTAQANGAGDRAEVQALLLRGLATGIALGIALFAVQLALIPLIFRLLAGGAALDAVARGYVSARFLGAPASLAVFAINGWLLGLGRTRAALALQIVMNFVNIVLDLLFVWHFGLGARGVGLGTACAEWTALATGLALTIRGPMIARWRDGGVFARAAMRRLFSVNADIMIRTVALLFLFTWFTNAGARLGPTVLAANHVLMQFVSVSAFVLDGFAFTAESRVGHAIGEQSPAALRRAIRLTGEFSAAAGLAFTAAILIAGPSLVALLTNAVAVRDVAVSMLPYAALVPLVGMPAWLLDGVFIGATAGRALRNAAAMTTACYVAIDLALRPLGVTGLWLALLASYVLRALTLGIRLPRLFRTVAPAPSSA